MDEERIDLNPLDPASNTARWERMVRAVVAGALEASRRPTLLEQLLSWRRQALAVAAMLAAIAIFGALAVEGTAAEHETDAAPNDALVSWALRDIEMSSWDTVAMLGGFDESP